MMPPPWWRQASTEVSFTVFSTNPELRRKYMNDKNAEIALECLKIFCKSCEVYAAVVLIPGVNDGAELEKTCSDLEDMGAKGLILMRFANAREQGLILGNAPIMPGITPHSVEEFQNIVTETAAEASLAGNRNSSLGSAHWSALCPGPPSGKDRFPAAFAQKRNRHHQQW